MSQLKSLLSIKDVASILSISTTTVWRHAKAGVIPAPIKIGGSTRWRKADVEELLELTTPQ
jgi:excisionase family DNA binding protein